MNNINHRDCEVCGLTTRGGVHYCAGLITPDTSNEKRQAEIAKLKARIHELESAGVDE